MMTSERHALIKEIFLAAVSRPPGERGALLDERCAGDANLRREVESLLAHHEDSVPGEVGSQPTPLTDVWRQAGPLVDLDAEQTAAVPHAAVSQTKRRSVPDLRAGDVVAGRYRIVSQLGAGGMGIVYRAEDLTLGQTVALKFLDPVLGCNLDWLARFRNEVRLARGVTHANVCRVFDIGEADGQTFLSMEYVDGEDLATLLRRIGRLPGEKAVDIARQTCIGLAAAHAAGILHRDLKPANIMLDGRGQVRLMDFGLAAYPETLRRVDVRAGTPAYMAPEQIDGYEVSTRSDLYSLGLVMYELLAGRPVFEGKSYDEFAELHRHAEPRPLTELVPDVDPEMARVVDLCLRKNAHDRPSSALAVAVALPGTDPLAIALAANVTPSPEMVAAAGPQHGRMPAAGLLLVFMVALLAGLALVRGQAPFPWELPTSKAPAVLADRAKELVQKAGYALDAPDSALGYCEVDFAKELTVGRPGADVAPFPLAAEARSNLVFWYRQSVRRLIPTDVDNVAFGRGRVTLLDPSPTAPGMVSVVFDLTGRLLLFVAVPQSDVPDGRDIRQPLTPDQWAPFLDLANLTASELLVTEPAEDSLFEADDRVAWRAARVAGAEGPARVDAAAWHGRPVFFAVRLADRPVAMRLPLDTLQRRGTLIATSNRVLLLVIAIVALPWAWRNHRSGRGDRRGAMHLALVVLIIELVVWVLQAKHVAEFNAELLRFCLAITRALGTAALVAVFYVALEPYARRHWPQMLIVWSRALSGRVRDPLVGGHLLIGACVGGCWALLIASERVLVEAFGWGARHSLLSGRIAEKLISGRAVLAGYLGAVPQAIVQGLLFLLLLAVLRTVVRSPRWAAVLSALALLPLVVPHGAHMLTAWLFMGVGVVGLAVWLMIRYGLVALSTALFIVSVLNAAPMTFDVGAWYGDITLYALMIVGGIVAYGFAVARRPSTARQPGVALSA